MKNFIVFLLVWTVSISIVNAQSSTFTDDAMESMAQQSVMRAISPVEADVVYTSLVIMQNATGKVLTNLNRSRSGDEWVEDNDHEVPANHTRLGLYLALLESGATPSDRFYSSGMYVDESGVFVQDRSWNHGGYGNLRLAEAVTRSDVSLLEACDQQFNRSMERYAYYFSLTGLRLTNNSEDYERMVWNPVEVLGYQNTVTPIEMAMWMQGVANHGVVMRPRYCQSDSQEVLCHIDCQREYIDSLRSLLRNNVLYGSVKKVSRNNFPISGALFISGENVDGHATATFLGYTPTYTIVVNVEGSLPVIRRIPIQVAREVVDWNAHHRLGIKKQTEKRLPRGVD